MAPVTKQREASVRAFAACIERTFYKLNGEEKSNDDVKERASWLSQGMNQEIKQEMAEDFKKSFLSGDYLHTWSQIVEAAQDAEWRADLRKRNFSLGDEHSSSYEKDKENFYINQDGYLRVYTDGSCLRNGYPDAAAGIGVFFGEGHEANVSEPLGRNNIPKNNVAEIKAAVRAIKIAKKHGYRRLVVHTDSQFMMDCLMDPVWLLTWLGNGWKKADGTPVVLKVQLRELLMAMEKMEIKLIHVEGHKDPGNIQADALANKGAKLYEEGLRGDDN